MLDPSFQFILLPTTQHIVLPIWHEAFPPPPETHTLSITANLPEPVGITVDGRAYSMPLFLNFTQGNHIIDLPVRVLLANGTFYDFHRWGDGLAEPRRELPLNGSMWLKVAYEKVYRLRIRVRTEGALTPGPRSYAVWVNDAQHSVENKGGEGELVLYLKEGRYEIKLERAYVLYMAPTATLQITFNRWVDGVIDHIRDVYLDRNMELVAIYR